MAQKGTIVQILGPVVDVRFPSSQLPEIYNAIKVINPDRKINVTCEVAQHLGDDLVRCVALSTTDGLVRGMEAEDTGAPISVPVGMETLGRVFNLLGDPIDELGPANEKKRLPIHRPAPQFEDQKRQD